MPTNKKAVLRFLTRGPHRVHAAQALSQRFHHMRCEMRVLLNEKMEPPFIDWRQSAVGLRHSVGSTRTVINQRHLADEASYTCGLKQKIAMTDIDLPFQ